MKPPIDRENAVDAEFTVVQRAIAVAKTPLPWIILVIFGAVIISKAGRMGLLW